MNKKRKNYAQVAFISGMWLLGSLLYPILYQYFGATGGAIFIVPVISIAWIFGITGGVLGGLLVIILVVLLQSRGQSGAASILQILPGPVIAICVGLATGWVSRLFYRSKALAAELALERSALIEQNKLRQQAEESLQKFNAELEERVLQRTEALRASNENLIRESEERKEAEAKLFTSEERLRQLAETIEDAIWLLELPSKQVLYISPACEKIFGYSKDLLEKNPWIWLNDIYSEDREKITAILTMPFFGEMQSDEEYRIVDKSGSIKWLSTRTFLLKDEQGEIYRIAGIIKDITVRKSAEELVRASLREKEVLLKEIHHRVKNNLQVISSLLRLASERITDPLSRQAFQESQNRVHSMALIHEKLYRSKDMAQIDFKDYVYNLTGFLFRSYQNTNCCATLDLEVQDANLDIDEAIPCGLILNELVSNALKYAFPAGNSGKVYVRFFLANQGEYCLEVADTGAGLPFDFENRLANSLGLVLVNTLVEQLRGRMEVNNNQGARFSIFFPVSGNRQ